MRAGALTGGPLSGIISVSAVVFFFFQAEDGIRDLTVTGVQTCALPIYRDRGRLRGDPRDQPRDPPGPSRRGPHEREPARGPAGERGRGRPRAPMPRLEPGTAPRAGPEQTRTRRQGVRPSTGAFPRARRRAPHTR